jgi:PST family polysaccharide transporter
MPLIALIAVYADSVISLILGQKWMASAQILQILAIGAVVEPIASTCGIVMITSAKTKEYLHVGIAQAVLVSSAVLIGISWGLVGLAVAYVSYTLLTLPFLVWYSFRGTPISPAIFFEAIKFPAIATAITTLFLLGVRHFIHLHSAFLDLACAGILGACFYCVLWTVVPDGKRRLAEYWSHFMTAINEIRSRIFVPVSQTSS